MDWGRKSSDCTKRSPSLLGVPHLIVLLLALVISNSAHARNFALLISANDGLLSDDPLYFAHQDGERMSALLRSVSGVGENDILHLKQPEVDTIIDTLEGLEIDGTLTVYYSGHGSYGALHLGSQRLLLDTLNQAADSTGAKLVVLIIDACSSGSALRPKGLRKVSADTPRVERLAEGRVVMTSSAADEDSQESEAIGGSVFTHHLISALRGAADQDRNGVITLDEAYRYTYGRTVTSTLTSPTGPQHPHFDIDLRGYGEVVLSRPDTAEAHVVIAPEPKGTYYISDRFGLRLLAEIPPQPQSTKIAIPAGEVRIVRHHRGTTHEAWVEVGSKTVARIPQDLEFERTDGLYPLSQKGRAEIDSRMVLKPRGVFSSVTTSAYSSLPGRQRFHFNLDRNPDQASLRLSARVDLQNDSTSPYPQSVKLGIALGPRFQRGALEAQLYAYSEAELYRGIDAGLGIQFGAKLNRLSLNILLETVHPTGQDDFFATFAQNATLRWMIGVGYRFGQN